MPRNHWSETETRRRLAEIIAEFEGAQNEFAAATQDPALDARLKNSSADFLKTVKDPESVLSPAERNEAASVKYGESKNKVRDLLIFRAVYFIYVYVLVSILS